MDFGKPEPIEICNARITSTRLDAGDHGCLVGWIGLDYGGTCQSFGGWSLFNPYKKFLNKEKNYAGLFIWRVMEIAEVTSWEKLVGKTIRVKYSHSKVHAIGHILEDKWFEPSIEFQALEMGKLKLED